MNKAVLMSIRPQHACNILNGIKKYEIRKRFPKDFRGWVYMYVTRDYKKVLFKDFYGWLLNTWNKNKKAKTIYNGKVVARFYVDNVDKLETEFYKNQPLYDEDTVYQAVKRVCLDQLDYVDNNEDECDRDELYTNEIYEDEEKNNKFLNETCLTGKQLQKYFKNGLGVAYSIHISELEIFDRPKALNEFSYYNKGNANMRYVVDKAPQSWAFIEMGE